MEIPLRAKYLVHRGFIKRGAPIGGGDQGNKHSRKKKMKEKDKTPNRSRVYVYDAQRGKGRMQDG